MGAEKTTNEKVTKQQIAQQKKQEYIQKFAQLTQQKLRDLNTSSNGTTVTFSTYDKDDILSYLKSPETNAKNLRNASIQMYQNSSQYRRLIQYYALLPMWAYTISPLGFDSQEADAKSYLEQYTKILSRVESMNIKHEMAKALTTAFRDGVIYGAIWSGKNSWFVQRINPDICQLSTIEDGTWLYSVDMSQIKEKDLFKYPPEFTTMYNTYKSTKVKQQEVPSKISFCLKADETVIYPIPPWVSVLPSIYELELYKDLAEIATEIQNYKLIGMKIPVDKDGVPTMDFNLASKFYDQLANNLPEYVGAAMSPMGLDSIDFNKSQAGNTTDEISDATQRFWYSSGTSPLLFGDASNNSSSALALSIKTDEEIVLSAMAQCERLLNRHLKSISGSIKFKINILPITIFNQEKMIGFYKEAATLGLPTKMQYAAAINISPSDVSSMCFIENDVLELNNKFIPLKTSYTQTSKEPGRNPLSEEDLGAAGEATSKTDGND